MAQDESLRRKLKHYSVRTPMELDEGIQVHMAQWLKGKPKHCANDWWCEAARLMLRRDTAPPRTTSRQVESPRAIVRHEEPQPGEIIEREDGTSLVYDGEVEVPEMAQEPTPARMPTLPAHVAGKVTQGFTGRSDGRVIPTKESRLKPQPVIAPRRVE